MGALVAAVLVGPALLAAVHAADSRGPWTWPLAGRHEVSRPFAPPAFRYGVGHRGVDLPAAAGAVVHAAGAGRVSYAGLLAGRGVVVVVHGDLRTTYEPVEAAVGVGDRVGAGTPLGRLAAGHAGCAGAACLHWGLRRGDDYLDPVRLVDRVPVRLLPVGPPVTDGPAATDGLTGGGPAAHAPPPPDAPPVRLGGGGRAAAGDGSVGADGSTTAPVGHAARGAPTAAVAAAVAVAGSAALVAGAGTARRRRGGS